MQLETRDAAPEYVSLADAEMELLRGERRRAATRLFAAARGTKNGVVGLLSPTPWFRRFPAVGAMVVLGAVLCLGVALLRRDAASDEARGGVRRFGLTRRQSWLDWLGDLGSTFFATLRRAIIGGLTARLLLSDARTSAAYYDVQRPTVD